MKKTYPCIGTNTNQRTCYPDRRKFLTYGKYVALRHTVIFGGVSQVPQLTALRRGADIVVATPGRLIDLINQ